MLKLLSVLLFILTLNYTHGSTQNKCSEIFEELQTTHSSWPIERLKKLHETEQEKNLFLQYIAKKYPQELLDRVNDIALHINGYQQGQIYLYFWQELEIAKAKSKVQKNISTQVTNNSNAINSNDNFAPIAVIYPEFLAVKEGEKNSSFNDLISLLPYYKKLGIKGFYILPHYKSPMADGGYDIEDYYETRTSLGGNNAFFKFINAAKKNGINTFFIDFVPGHVSEKNNIVIKAKNGDPSAKKQLITLDPSSYDYEVFQDKYGKTFVNYFHRDGRTSTRFLEFKDAVEFHFSDDGYYHTFLHEQYDRKLDEEESLKELLNVLGFWVSQGVTGIRADAIRYWIKHWGDSGDNLPESHKLAEYFHLFLKLLNKDSIFLPEAVLGIELASAYLGQETSIHGTITGSEGDALFAFEEMMHIKYAFIMEDFEPWVKFLDRKRRITLPKGTFEINLIHGHDEWQIGFIPKDKRAAFRKHLINMGGGIFKDGYSGGARLNELLGRNSSRLKALYKFIYGMKGIPALYYGDELGTRNNWQYTYQVALDRLERNFDKGLLDKNKFIKLKTELAKQNKNIRPSESSQLWEVLDMRNIHRGPIPKRVYDLAEQGKNDYFNNVKDLANIRNSSKALSSGGIELVLHTLDNKVGSFIRRYYDKTTKQLSEEVAIVANTTDKSLTVNLNANNFKTQNINFFIELESKNKIFPIRGKDFYTISIEPYTCLYLKAR